MPRCSLALLLLAAGCSPAHILQPGSSSDGGSSTFALDAGGSDAGSSDGGVDAGALDGGPLDAGDPVVDATFVPTPLDLDAGDLTNPLRGQYLWLGQPAYPSGWTDRDVYMRVEWITLEPDAGNIQWSLIDQQLAIARSNGGRFGMRVMALCQGCASHQYNNAYSSIPDDLAAVSNPLIGAAPGETRAYVLPDWNSNGYLDRLQTLVSAIGAHYANDPTFAWMDVSSYGNWGEFHLYPFDRPGGPYDNSTQRPITDANAKRIVDMNAAAFANKLPVVPTGQPGALAEAVATTSPPVGIRVDCLGSDGLAGAEGNISNVPGADTLWRRAPFITEWCQYNLGSSGADLFVQGEQQVRQFHVSMLSSGNFNTDPSTPDELAAFRAANLEAGYRLRPTQVEIGVHRTLPRVDVRTHWVNDGVAPTYFAWRPVLVFTGPTTMEVPLSLDLRAVVDVPVDDDELADAPTVLASGTYAVSLRVDDAQGSSVPLALGIEGRAADGSYPLGTLTIP